MKNFRLHIHNFFGKIFNLNPKNNLGTIAPDRSKDLMFRSKINSSKEVVGIKDYPNKNSNKRYYKGHGKQQRYYKDQNK